jgi:[ribosomal protein S5]-alanine N-acetyltransferase
MIIPKTANWSSGIVELFMLEPDHVTERYVQWLNDPGLNRYLESRFSSHTLESTRAFVAGCRQSDHSVMFGMSCKDPELQHVGNIKIEINRPHRMGEVGILVGEKQVHGKGVATEAIRIVTRIAREELGLRRLTAGCYASNLGSERAFAKAGFAVEARRPDHFLLDNRPEGFTLMGIQL